MRMLFMFSGSDDPVAHRKPSETTALQLTKTVCVCGFPHPLSMFLKPIVKAHEMGSTS